MVSIIKKDYATGYCEFAIDSDEDIVKLPRIGVEGKDTLTTIKSCCQGSLAIGTHGKTYILKGDRNTWIELTSQVNVLSIGSNGNFYSGKTDSGIPARQIVVQDEPPDNTNVLWVK